MAYKPFSQKAARFFEIVCYVLLIPAIISILFTLKEASFLALIPFIITVIGVVLLVGYQRHSRGTFDKDKLSLLWLGTLIFNGIPLIPIFYKIFFSPDRVKKIISRLVFEDTLNNSDFSLNPVGLFLFILVSWWLIAFSLSITLLLNEFRSDLKIK